MDRQSLLRRIRFCIGVIIVGLLLSGVTAIPLETELKLLAQWSAPLNLSPGFGGWVHQIRDALIETNRKFPFMAYGTDWLAFAHFVIALAFVGPWREPVRNKWVIQWGIMACFLVIVWPFIIGPIRQIPVGWRLIDSAFGAAGLVPLWLCWRDIARLEGAVSNSPQVPQGKNK